MIEGSTGSGAGATAPPPATSATTGARVVLAETPWCGECKRIAPLVEAVAASHPEVRLERVDVSAGSAMATGLRVRATPTLIGFIEHGEIARIAGRRGRDEIERFFAAIESGTRPPRTSKTEGALRVIAGSLLTALGILAGPSWLLLAVGAGICGYGLVELLPTRQ